MPGKPVRKKVRLDQLLVDGGWFADVRAATGPVMAGQVRVGDEVVTKVGTMVDVEADIVVKGQDRYASRGGYKLARALDAFGIDVTGLSVLDAGASTGGFTDCLLQRGAAKVFAVDVGYGQLRGRLAADARVVSMERTNISDLVDKRPLPQPVGLCTADLAYLSLLTAIPILAVASGNAPMVCLVKPLYEGLGDDRKDNREAIMAVMERLVRALDDSGFGTLGAVVSPIYGGRGAIECLVHVVPGRHTDVASLMAALAADWDENAPREIARG